MPDDTNDTPPAYTPDVPAESCNRVEAAARALLVGDVDQRTAPARLYRATLAEVLNDQGSGPLSANQRMAAQRIAALHIVCEGYEAAMLAGEPIDTALYFTACNTFKRACDALGMTRAIRTAEVPTFQEWQAQHPGDGEIVDSGATS